MSFVGAQPSAVSGSGQQPGKYNYLIGNDRSKWARNARSFSEAIAEQPYSGISVRYSTEKGAPRYDVLVKPGADPSRVGMKIDGADHVQVSPDGNLLLSTSLGTVQESGLIAYQDAPGLRTRVPCRMVMDGNVVHFDVGSYDTSRALVIDPLVYSSFISGGVPSPTAVGLDGSNNVYVAGSAQSDDFPTTVGAYQRSGEASAIGLAFLCKLNPSESSLIYSTYLGNSDDINALAVDSTGDVTVVGQTQSASFPVTAGAFQTALQGNANAFVTKLNSSGSDIVYSTYLGGGGNGGDVALCVAVDSSGMATVGGQTPSTNFPTTPGAILRTNRTSRTGFLTRFNPTGTALVFSTYLGGTGAPREGSDSDTVTTVSVDAAGNSTVGGQTTSADFPVTTGAFQTTNLDYYGTFQGQGFVSRINPTGTGLLFSTYFGGSVDSTGINCLTTDTAGDVFVGGATGAKDFPITPGALRSTYSSAWLTLGFVSELNSTGSGLIFSTFLGGTIQDSVSCITLDPAGNPVVAGITASPDFPVTAGAVLTVHANPSKSHLITTGFVSDLGPGGASLLYSTYLGGTGTGASGDGCTSIAMNTLGQAVVTGNTTSVDFPTTAGAFQTALDPTFGALLAYSGGFLTTLDLLSGTSELGNIDIVPGSVVAGYAATGVVTLTNSSATDTVVNLSQPSGLTVPLTVTVPAGYISQQFAISTSAVVTPTTSTIRASAGTQWFEASLTVTPLVPTEVDIHPSSVVGGSSTTGHVSLSSKSPNGTSVSLDTNSAAAATPTSITVPEGIIDADFTIQTSPVAAATQVQVTAMLSGVSVSQTLTVTPAALDQVSVSPASISGGASVQGTVFLNGSAAATDAISLFTSSAVATFATSVNVLPGESSAQFTIGTEPVSSNTSVTITASFANVSKQTTLLVTTPAISSLTLTPSSVLGGASTDGIVDLPAPAGAGGVDITITSNNANASVQGSFRINAGDSSNSFPISTKAVTTATLATISVSLGGTVLSQTLTITPPGLAYFFLDPVSVVGGTNSDGLVRLPAPTIGSGTIVQISSNNPAAIVQPSLRIAGGESYNSFPILTKAVTTTTPVTITVTYGSSVLQRTLTITP